MNIENNNIVEGMLNQDGQVNTTHSLIRSSTYLPQEYHSTKLSRPKEIRQNF